MARKTFNSWHSQNKIHKKIIVRLSCEGKTEVNYFEALNQTSLSEKYTFKSCYNKSKNRADQVVERLFNHWTDIDYEKDLLFAVYDKDENTPSQHNRAKQIIDDKINQFNSKGLSIDPKIIFSNPCFEIWIYYHFENNNKTMNAHELKNYCKKLHSQYTDFPKQFLQKLEDKREKAIQHAKLRLVDLERNNINTFSTNSGPNTNMNLIFEQLI